MDPEVVALSSAAAATLVTMMTTDAWTATKRAVLVLLRRGQDADPDADLAAALEETQQEVVKAVQRSDTQAVQDVTAVWAERFAQLVTSHPDALEPLRRFASRSAPEPVIFGDVTHSGTGDVIQIAGDATFNSRG